MIPQKQIEEISTELDIQQFESVDQIVVTQLDTIESNLVDKQTLIDIYHSIEID